MTSVTLKCNQIQYLVKALGEEIKVSEGEYAKSLIWLQQNLASIDRPMSAYKKRKTQLTLKFDKVYLDAMIPHCAPRIKHALRCQ